MQLMVLTEHVLCQRVASSCNNSRLDLRVVVQAELNTVDP
jgi:hypothetical protein